MKKVALVFVLAVFAPSLVLAWLAVRSVRDQQIVVAQQQMLLYQGVADALAKDVISFMNERQREFGQIVESLRRDHSSGDLANHFDSLLVTAFPSAEVGFTVSADGNVLSPSLFDRAEARQFRLNNDRFLGSCESVEVYWNSPKGAVSLGALDTKATAATLATKARLMKGDASAATNLALAKELADSKNAPEEAEFKQLVGDGFEGTVARFLQNQLKVLLWYRSVREPDLIYGAQLNLSNIVAGLQPVIRAPDSVRSDVRVALLNDANRVVAGETKGRRPFVISEIGSVLPHWRVGVYLNHPEAFTRNARSLRLMLMLIVVVMIAAIALGSALIVNNIQRHIALARQKTDFVSNVSHELKTPLTSIRMFSELLSEGKVTDETQRKQFLQIISSETARLTRLINNVLDFARMERGEKKYEFTRCDLKQIVCETVQSYRPQLEGKGFSVQVKVPSEAVDVKGDCDALAQVLVNLLSNAEKYASNGKEIAVELERNGAAMNGAGNGVALAQLKVLDRGPGVPRGCEHKIFEQFYRAHDSLSSGIQGSGLGLTLARQIARAHGGEVRYEARDGGGSCFVVEMPISG
jgi:signal transduction histidine kinase